MERFDKTVSALCYRLASGRQHPDDPLTTPPYNDIVLFAIQAVQRLPLHARLGIRLLTCLWPRAGLLQRFYGSLVLLALYDRAERDTRYATRFDFLQRTESSES